MTAGIAQSAKKIKQMPSPMYNLLHVSSSGVPFEFNEHCPKESKAFCMRSECCCRRKRQPLFIIVFAVGSLHNPEKHALLFAAESLTEKSAWRNALRKALTDAQSALRVPGLGQPADDT